MPRYRIHGGNVTIGGRTYNDGAVVDFDGRPPVGFEPIDNEALRRKLASIDDRTLSICSDKPQRMMLLARSVGEDFSTFDRARHCIQEWLAEQRALGDTHAGR